MQTQKHKYKHSHLPQVQLCSFNKLEPKGPVRLWPPCPVPSALFFISMEKIPFYDLLTFLPQSLILAHP